MAKLDITLSKEQHAALDESLKGFYVATQDGGFELEGIGSIQRALADEKAKKATKPELVQELEELKKFKSDHEADQQKAAQADLEAKGKYDEAIAAKEKAWNERLEAKERDQAKLLENLKRESLKNFLTDPKIGVLPDRVKAVIAEGDLDNILDFEFGDSGPTFKKKGGIGDEPELAAIFADLKEKAAWGFAASSASGSGASGSNGDGGGSSAQKWAGLPRSEKVAAIRAAGGNEAEAKKKYA